MRRVAEDVFQIALSPRDGVNAYLLGEVVVDAGTKGAGRRLRCTVTPSERTR